jgi:hypothetical protein
MLYDFLSSWLYWPPLCLGKGKWQCSCLLLRFPAWVWYWVFSLPIQSSVLGFFLFLTFPWINRELLCVTYDISHVDGTTIFGWSGHQTAFDLSSLASILFLVYRHFLTSYIRFRGNSCQITFLGIWHNLQPFVIFCLSFIGI